jgi:hypothetical protein
MPTLVTHSIKASGGDYTSLTAWAAGQARNLVTADQIAEAVCYGFIDTTPCTLLSGWFTDSTRYISIRAHDSAKATVPMTTDGSRYLLQISSGSGLLIRTSHVYVSDIQVYNTTNGTDYYGIRVQSSQAYLNNINIRNCVVRSSNTDAEGAPIHVVGGTLAADNCVAIMIESGGTTIQGAFVHKFPASATGRYRNCTAYVTGPRHGYIMPAGHNTVVVNCLARIDTGLAFSGSGFALSNTISTVSSSNNATNSGTTFGLNAKANQNFIFVNPSIGDYHLDWMDSGAKDSGINLSASFTTDFDGNTRTAPWHIGALGIGNSPNGIQLGRTGNTNIQLSSIGTSPITIR